MQKTQISLFPGSSSMVISKRIPSKMPNHYMKTKETNHIAHDQSRQINTNEANSCASFLIFDGSLFQKLAEASELGLYSNLT